jgi:hypothetical protein
MADNDTIRAGAIILKDLSLFNEAVTFFEQQVDPVIRNALGQSLREWTDDNQWKGAWDVSNYLTDMWVCPADWHENEDEPFARFRFGYRDASATDAYEIADLFGLGQTDFGFRFAPEHSWFGGKSGWNAFAKTIGDLSENIAGAGWINEGKGSFFYRVALAADSRVSAWENEDWSEALAPFTAALNKLKADKKFFDRILYRAKPKRG